jgi:2-polyprenyl-3-methyl-5-hydroxy-6-metoxy-1,4-benzoquinol methylase
MAMPEAAIEIKDSVNAKPFVFIDPPFNFNADVVNKFAPEISGNFLLQNMCARLGWHNLSDKLLLDFGCGVRFARTIVNLGIDVGLYTGIDVNNECITWLQSHVEHPNMEFFHFDMSNALYCRNGRARDDVIFPKTNAHSHYDAACMFSVITHQVPDDAQSIFSLLHNAVRFGGQMYFTAFLDETIDEYAEGEPETLSLKCLYNPSFLRQIVESQGWVVENIFRPTRFQQFGFCCRKA